MERKERLYLEVNHAVSENDVGELWIFFLQILQIVVADKLFANFAYCPFGLRGPGGQGGQSAPDGPRNPDGPCGPGGPVQVV